MTGGGAGKERVWEAVSPLGKIGELERTGSGGAGGAEDGGTEDVARLAGFHPTILKGRHNAKRTWKRRSKPVPKNKQPGKCVPPIAYRKEF
jgi:hypothetical protein